MTYSTKETSIESMAIYLDKLLLNRQTIDFVTQNPSAVAYRLRQAIHASAFWPQYEHYRELKRLYKFQCLRGYVRAAYVGPNERASSGGDARSPDAEARPDRPSLHRPDVHSLEEAIGAAVKFGPLTDELQFPEASLTEEDLTKLYEWASPKGWHLIPLPDEGFILSRRNVDETLAWRPA